MKLYEARNMIKDVFESRFDRDKYRYFIKNLLKNLEEKPFGKGGSYRGNIIPRAYQGVIREMWRIGKFKDKDGKSLDVLIVELHKEHSIEYARTTQRNFIRWYLNGSRGNQFKDAALVAFYTEKSPDWRFSLIKMQYSLKKKKDEITPAKRWSFLVGEKGKSHTAQQQLVSLLKNDNAPLLTDIENAFSIETVSDEFFEKYKTLLFNLKEELDKIIQKGEKIKTEFEKKNIDTLNFSKKLMGQIVFLYFLQKKGWLGLKRGQRYGEGNRNFMRDLFEQAKSKGKNFFNDYLEFLFYEALSKKRTTDFYKKFDCRIPFLNGGLFDPINFYDWEKTDIIIPNELFSNKNEDNEEGTGILDIFDLYNFTVKEDEPLEKEVAIDPEMLGKVFERMLEVKERKNKGAFYTPREIVHYMAQQSLLYYLETELNKTVSYENIAKNELEMFGNEIQNGQLNIVMENKEAIISKEDLETFIHFGEQIIDKDIAIEEGKLKETNNKYQIPESIRKNAPIIDKTLENIKICDPAVGSGAFPVGVMNEIVKLRNILTPFIEKKENRTAYDFKANAIQNSIYGVDIDAGAVEIAKLRLWLSMVVDESNIDRIDPLPNLEYKIVKGNSLINMPESMVRDAKLEEEIQNLTEDYYIITDKKEKQKQKEIIDKKIKQLLKSASEYTDYEIDFDFKLFSHEVFNKKGGFDIVIGNPPYVKEYTDKSVFDGTRSQECYQGKMDLWYLFGCKGIDILKYNSGLLSFIATNNWITNAGASKFRNKVLKETIIREFIDFGDYKIFENADIQTMVMFLEKNNKNNKYTCLYAKILDKGIDRNNLDTFLKRIDDTKFTFYKSIIDKNKLFNKPIHFLEKNIAIILDKIKNKANFKLGDNEVAQGIVGAPDKAFIIDEKEINKFLPEEKNYLKLFYTNANRYYTRKTTKYIFYLTKHNINSLDVTPNLKENLHFFIDKLKKRREVISKQIKYFHLQWPRDEKFFIEKDRIICSTRTKIPSCTYTNKEFYASRALNIIRTDRINLKYLTGLFNSKISYFWLKYKGKLTGDLLQVDKSQLLSIPIKKIKETKPFEILVDYIIYLKQQPEDSQSFYFEQIIDGMVYELYFEEEIKKADCEIIKHLKNLPKITEEMSDGEKQKTIDKVFSKLYDKNHPVRKNLEKMEEKVKEVKIIKQSLEK